jgi:threonine dehydrogenase-like Zn-dependent dehydrogenase
MSAPRMRAAIVTGPANVALGCVDLPKPGPTEILARLEGCGVCGSNLAPWEGRPWFKYPLPPGEPGHEGWGRIEQVGDRVERFKAGDRIALLSYHAYAEFDTADEKAVVQLPDELENQPFPGEALGCAMNVFARSDIQREQTVAIVGVGFLGAVLTSLCAKAGAKVIAISRRPFALEIARRMGAQETIPMEDRQAIIEQVKALTSGNGCERVIEAIGKQWPLDLASELTRERGRLVIAGYHQDGPRQVNLQLWNWRGLDVINAHERDPQVYVRGMNAAVEAVASGQFDPSPLYTHCFSLPELGQALEAMRERPRSFLKAIVRTDASQPN